VVESLCALRAAAAERPTGGDRYLSGCANTVHFGNLAPVRVHLTVTTTWGPHGGT